MQKFKLETSDRGLMQLCANSQTQLGTQCHMTIHSYENQKCAFLINLSRIGFILILNSLKFQDMANMKVSCTFTKTIVKKRHKNESIALSYPSNKTTFPIYTINEPLSVN